MRAAALMLVLASTAGCSFGSGTGSVTGSLWLNQCTTETSLGSSAAPVAFNLHPTYFVALPVDDNMHLESQNHLTVRIQSEGTQLEESDLIYITVADVAQVAMQLDQPIDVGPSTNLRATLGLFRTCPQESVQLELDGTITFSAFGVIDPASPVLPGFHLQYGDPLTAQFDFTVVDRRAITLGGVGGVPTTPDAGGNLTGNFDFKVAQGRAAQPF